MNPRHISALLLIQSSITLLLSAAEPTYRELHRPQFHFTPAKNWMNDPNGMVFYDGEFHLFYQYNPFGDKWGHMSWGHAVSPDMVHWEHLPVALYEEDGVMIFSGSAVVDWTNTSGFGKNGEPPLVAIYTGHYTEKPLQNQQIAYSTDRGRTWTKYRGNPVLDIGKRDFRDPKVMWHPETEQWIMTVSLPTDRKVQFHGSPNLKDWTLLGEFGPAGAVRGIWECPDLFPVKIEGSNRTKWVLIINIGGSAVAGGSGCQYFVGDFDGREFTLDRTHPAGKKASSRLPRGELFADFEGVDFGSWKPEGASFAGGPKTDHDAFAGYVGDGIASSWGTGDRDQGTLTSPEFEVHRDRITFLIGGGNHPGETCFNLIVNGEVVRTATGNNSGEMNWHSWDVAEFDGETALLQVVDRHSGGWGQVFVDHIVFHDNPFDAPGEPALWIDHAKDFYAAVSWADLPESDGRRLWLGWMSNWQYANDVPTSPWRSAMSIPRELQLRRVDGTWQVIQKPVGELRQLRTAVQHRFDFERTGSGDATTTYEIESLGNRYELIADIRTDRDAVFSFEFCRGEGEFTTARFDLKDGVVTLDRTRSGIVDFSGSFPAVFEAPVRRRNRGVTVQAFVDTSSVELFINDGETVMTSLVLPKPDSTGFRFATEKGVKSVELRGWQLDSVWDRQ